MCTYEDLVAATLPFGLAPLVVPQLKTITLGGAVTGLGIESTSFRNGLPHESVLEMDILTGAGEVVTASPERARRPVPRLPQFVRDARLRRSPAHRTRARAAVRRAHASAIPFARRSGRRRWTASSRPVATTGSRSTTSTASCSAPTRAICASGRRPRHPARSATTPASRSSTGPSSTMTAPRIDRLTIHDYLWRWDTDWFWCSGRVRGAASAHPAILAAAVPAQQRLLEAHEARTALRHRRSPREAARPPAT